MSLQPGYFDGVYADSDDPWGFADRWYEQRKRSLLLAALPRPRFRDAFEPGCSTGELTAALAPRCERLLATDVAERPLAAARARVAGQSHVSVQQLQVPQQWPPRRFDLIVLSELGYYLDEADLDQLLSAAATTLAPDGVLVTCHWRHPAPEYPQTGDEVAAAVNGAARRHDWVSLVAHVEEDFLLDVHGAPGVASVAHADGLLAGGAP